MSSTHAPRQPSPFDRLPNELLVKVLLHLPPPTISLHHNPPLIENAPFAVSLVSKRFHAFSGDLIWRRAAVAAEWSTVGFLRAVALLAQWPAVGRGGLELDLQPQWIHTVEERRLRDWAVILFGVERIVLRLFELDDLDFDDLARFDNLRHLSLVSGGAWLLPTAIFPRLESMRITFSGLHTASPGPTSREFPVLRHLAVYRPCVPYEDPDGAVFSDAFLGQLDSFETSVEGWGPEPDSGDRIFALDAPPSSVPVLWRVAVGLGDPLHRRDDCLTTTSIPYGQHLLLEVQPGQEPDVPVSVHWERIYVELRRLVALHAHSRLRLVLVSGAGWRRPEATPPELAALEALEGDCARRGVALRPCEPPRVEDGALPEFMAFLREEAARARS